MRQPKDRRPVAWKQLCAIARQMLEAEPTISDAEWSERIKARISRLELTYPTDRTAIARAMLAVQTALEKQGWQRPRPPVPQSERPPEWRGPLLHAESLEALTTIHQAVANSPPPSPPSGSASNTLSPVCDAGRPGWIPLATLMSTALPSTRMKPDKAQIVQRQIAAWRAQQRTPQQNILTPHGWVRVPEREDTPDAETTTPLRNAPPL